MTKKKAKTAEAPIWFKWPLSRLKDMPDIVRDGLGSEEAVKAIGAKVSNLGELVTLLDKAGGNDEAVALLCKLPSVGGTRAQGAIDALASLRAATAATRSLHPEARENIMGTRQEQGRKAREGKAKGVLRMEVKPGRRLVFPWDQFEPRTLKDGEDGPQIVFADDPLVNPTEETLAKLKAEGINAETFNQEHKIWPAEEEHQNLPMTPINDRKAIRAYAILGYEVPISTAAQAPRIERRRRIPSDTTPEATAESEDDAIVPDVDAPPVNPEADDVAALNALDA